ncbi:hypothetical protein BDN71DRAFT_926843 [Pleurotus eryngii]|uniref:Uncharacterized protein n=1 Tax=Pleurotus eryngii TaxID=5323 RepID=A0A9P5ZYV1_PLEER|nr:hypothetical protein BDN71DRAFT_926843 [Pleurotus eryngii]
MNRQSMLKATDFVAQIETMLDAKFAALEAKLDARLPALEGKLNTNSTAHGMQFVGL